MTQTPSNFGARLRELRQRAEKTLKDLAELMGWSVVYVSDIERNKRNPPEPDVIKKIAKFLDANASELIDLANRDRKRVELDLEGKSPELEKAALILARSWRDLSADQAEQILKILETKEA